MRTLLLPLVLHFISLGVEGTEWSRSRIPWLGRRISIHPATFKASTAEEERRSIPSLIPRQIRGGSLSTPTAATNNNNTTTQNVTTPLWKQRLPEPLRSKGPKTFQKIRLDQVDIYLLGTAHVSNDSSADTQALLTCTQPDCIFVELCDARIALLEGNSEDANQTTTTSEAADAPKKATFWQKVTETQQVQGGSRLQALSTNLLTSVQEDYAEKLGVELGGEFRCAYRYWVAHPQRPHLILGDRPLQLTLIRAWESLWWWPKIKVLVALLWSTVKKPSTEEIREWLQSVMQEESDVLTESFSELRKHFPTLYETIVEERDAYLAAKLFQTCRALNGVARQKGQRQSVVAIVGAGHVPGICQWLTEPSRKQTPEQVLAELVTTKRWANDEVVQKQMIPTWTTQVTELNDQVPH